jgi:hypothetical protein
MAYSLPNKIGNIIFIEMSRGRNFRTIDVATQFSYQNIFYEDEEDNQASSGAKNIVKK